ncbi:effector-associated domain 2-containing protein [Nocardia sp. CA-145437]|uniref:effector-associated domain 2-containing protein n=1 Tax=Nocardia sp. CA-145437 TaxID=3239980 RepID=UPI003D979C97
MEKVVLVLVHGIDSDGHSWDRLIELLDGDDKLRGNFSISNFEYPTGKAEWRSKRSFPNIAAIARGLATRLKETVPQDIPVVFAAHSQGGLVVQRYLVQELDAGRGEELRRVKRVLMFATPNSGSEYASMLRKIAGRFVSNAQEAELRPIAEQVTDTQNKLLDRVVNAAALTATTTPIPFEAYAGLSDNVVKHTSATFVFPYRGALSGDHSSIIRPRDRESEVYRIVQARLLNEINVPQPPGSPPAGRDQRSVITRALSEINSLGKYSGRHAFVAGMPPRIKNYVVLSPDNPPMLDLRQIVDVCLRYEATGRGDLMTAMSELLEAADPAVGRAIAAVEESWPVR